jgi:hypothetical protein
VAKARAAELQIKAQTVALVHQTLGQVVVAVHLRQVRLVSAVERLALAATACPAQLVAHPSRELVVVAVLERLALAARAEAVLALLEWAVMEPPIRAAVVPAPLRLLMQLEGRGAKVL